MRKPRTGGASCAPAGKAGNGATGASVPGRREFLTSRLLAALRSVVLAFWPGSVCCLRCRRQVRSQAQAAREGWVPLTGIGSPRHVLVCAECWRGIDA